MNRMYKDMQENFPLIFASQLSAYAEDYFAYENSPKTNTNPTLKRSRNGVKRSAKRSSAAKSIHKLEKNIDFPVIFPQKSQTLILPIRFDPGDNSFYVKTPFGDIYITQHESGKRMYWFASWQDRKTAKDPNPFRALAKLLGQKWGEHKFSDFEFSLFDMFADITFDYGQKPNVRNRTRKIEMAKHADFRLVFAD